MNCRKLLSLCLLVLFSHNGKSEELVIAMGNFEPLFANSGKPSLFKDLIDGVYRYIPDRKITYRYMLSNSRLVIELNNGTVDGAANIFSKQEIKGCVTDPIFGYSDVAITKKNGNLKIKSINDLSKYKVVSYQRAKVLLGDKYKNAVADSQHYSEVAHPEVQAKLLSTGMVDVSVGDKYIFLHSLQSWSKGQLDVNDFIFHDIFPPVASAIGFNEQRHCDEFDQALVKFKQSGEYQAVYDYHLNRLGYKTSPDS